MVKGKRKAKSKKISKGKVRLPEKVKKGQITKKEMKSVGYVTSDNKLKNSAPVESMSGIGVKRGEMLRKSGIESVGDYKKSFKIFLQEQRASKKHKPVKKPKPSKKPKKVKPKPSKYEKDFIGESKYYIVENKTGKILSKALDSREEAGVKSKLFKSDSTIILAKPESVERMGLNIKQKHTQPKPIKKSQSKKSESPFLDKQVLEIEDLVKANDYDFSKQFVTDFSESDFDSANRLLNTKLTHLDSIERDMGVLKDTEANRKALTRLNEVQKLTKDSIDEWDAEKEKFLSKKEKKPSKSTAVSQKKGGGNNYIADELLPELIAKPKLKDWKNDEGKIRKRALRKHVIKLYEAEYGKDSEVVVKQKEFTKIMTGAELFKGLNNLRKSYPNNFPPEDELLKAIKEQEE